MAAKKRQTKKARGGFSEKEKFQIGIWAVILLFASIGNMAFYYQITIYKQFYMVIPWIIVVMLQFISLIGIYKAAGGK